MATEVKAWRDKEHATSPRQWCGAYKWGGYWHTVKTLSGKPRHYATEEAAREAARRAGPSV